MSIVRLLHTSDLHIGAHFHEDPSHGHDESSSLRDILRVGRSLNVDLLVIAGDLFDSPRVDRDSLQSVASMLLASGLATLILPGNHDCLVPESAYVKNPLSEMAPNVRVIVDPGGEVVRYPQADLAVWGRPHVDYSDFFPMGSVPPRGPEKWQVAVAHGLYVQEGVSDSRGWRIFEAELVTCKRDYVALGHLEVFNRVGNGGTATYYSGSPKQTGSVVLVELGGPDPVSVSQVALFAPDARSHQNLSDS